MVAENEDSGWELEDYEDPPGGEIEYMENPENCTSTTEKLNTRDKFKTQNTEGPSISETQEEDKTPEIPPHLKKLYSGNRVSHPKMEIKNPAKFSQTTLKL